MPTSCRQTTTATSTSRPSGVASRPGDGHPLIGCGDERLTTEEEDDADDEPPPQRTGPADHQHDSQGEREGKDQAAEADHDEEGAGGETADGDPARVGGGGAGVPVGVPLD